MTQRPAAPTRPRAGDRHVALLRGINVGGKNRLPMRELAAMFEAAGCRDVRTYIQSGNVVFTAKPRAAARVPAAITDRIAEVHGARVPVVLRTAAQLAAVARDNPFLGPGVDLRVLHVAFLADEPSGRRVEALDPGRSPPDELVVRGREIYLRCPHGIGRTRLTNDYFDTTLGTVSTVRNWRTVLEVLALAGP